MRTVLFLNRWNDLFHLMLTKVDGEQRRRRVPCFRGRSITPRHRQVMPRKHGNPPHLHAFGATVTGEIS
jgi:hypothetical protein